MLDDPALRAMMEPGPDTDRANERSARLIEATRDKIAVGDLEGGARL